MTAAPSSRSAPVPGWVRTCAWLAVAASLPTVAWRALVGLGLHLGTPDHWRAIQSIPGSGTVYVFFLSAVQLLAALLTLRLISARGDVVPQWSPIAPGRRLPTGVVAGIASLGVAILALLCIASAFNWHLVNPFAGHPLTGWTVLAYGCYGVAPLWPVFLLATLIGYVLHRRPARKISASVS